MAELTSPAAPAAAPAPRPAPGAAAGAFLGRHPLLSLLVKRLWLALVTLFLVSVLVFVIARVMPGDVGRSILGPYASAAQVAALDRKLGLDRPILAQYGSYIWGFVRGDWGTSPVLSVPVRPYVMGHLVNSLYLAGLALVEIIPLSIGLGIVAGWFRDRWPDRLISVVGVSLLALPEFVSGTILIVVFSIELRALPSSAAVPDLSIVDILHNLLLPSLPLLFVLFGYIARMTRAGTADALSSNYARTAYLKGLSGTAVLWKHVLRNSLTPTITVIAVQLGYLIGGLVVTERLFNYPGIGNLIYTAATDHDQAMLQAGVLLIAGVYTVANTLADLLYAVLNPRLRLGGS
ncbi:MAG: ABC transporter permease [Streptosporangiales bacterium]|nr:ABC transporter permease [Streptosporangiales bacterium]